MGAAHREATRHLEDALSDEAGGTRGHVLPLPSAPVSTDPKVDALADLRADVNSLRGRTALVVSTAGNWGQGPAQEAPRTDWRPQRLGFDAPASAGSLRSETGAAILSALGCSADLFSGGASAREAWRRFLHGSVQPLGDLLAAELADKLDAPGLRLTFDRLFASDVASRARALKELTAAGVELGRSATAGWSELMPYRVDPCVVATPPESLIAELRERFEAFADPAAYSDQVVERAIKAARAEFCMGDDGAIALAAHLLALLREQIGTADGGAGLVMTDETEARKLGFMLGAAASDEVGYQRTAYGREYQRIKRASVPWTMR